MPMLKLPGNESTNEEGYIFISPYASILCYRNGTSSLLRVDGEAVWITDMPLADLVAWVEQNVLPHMARARQDEVWPHKEGPLEIYNFPPRVDP
jgi:hypothetical protein